jgi:hypothetical protein
VFIHGYAKNEKSDLEPREAAALRIYAKGFLRLTSAERLENVNRGALLRIEE